MNKPVRVTQAGDTIHLWYTDVAYSFKNIHTSSPVCYAKTETTAARCEVNPYTDKVNWNYAFFSKVTLDVAKDLHAKRASLLNIGGELSLVYPTNNKFNTHKNSIVFPPRVEIDIYED